MSIQHCFLGSMSHLVHESGHPFSSLEQADVKSLQKRSPCALLRNTTLNDSWQCISQSPRDGRESLFPGSRATTRNPQLFFSSWLCQKEAEQKICPAARRSLRAPPYCPLGEEIGSPTADIQSVRKSSWLSLQNVFGARPSITTSPEPACVKPPLLRLTASSVC